METQSNSNAGEQLSLANVLGSEQETPNNPDTSDASDTGELEVTEEQKLEMLKKKATLMGVEFSNNIKAETLLARINAKLEEGESVKEEAEVTASEESEAFNNATPAVTPTQEPAEKSIPVNEQASKAVKASAPLTPREQLKREAMKLVRVRITNLDPKKKDLGGEIFTVANDILGAVKLFVPYGEVTDDGWHLPMWVFKQLEKRRFLHIRTSKDRQTGQQKVEHFYAKEFSLEVLPALSQEELDVLARNQAAAGSIQQN